MIFRKYLEVHILSKIVCQTKCTPRDPLSPPRCHPFWPPTPLAPVLAVAETAVILGAFGTPNFGSIRTSKLTPESGSPPAPLPGARGVGASRPLPPLPPGALKKPLGASPSPGACPCGRRRRAGPACTSPARSCCAASPTSSACPPRRAPDGGSTAASLAMRPRSLRWGGCLVAEGLSLELKRCETPARVFCLKLSKRQK